MLNYRRSALVRLVARRRALKTLTAGHIDESSFGEPRLIKPVSGSDVPRGAPYFISGWTVDLGRKRIPWDVRIEIDGKEVPAVLRLGLPRPDIAALIGSAKACLSGFTAVIHTGSLAVGPHELSVRSIVGRLGTAFARIEKPARFFILDQFADSCAPPTHMAANPGTYFLDPVPAVPDGSVLELTGWGLDDRARPFVSIAGRIDDQRWNQGWTGVQRSDNSRHEARRGTVPAGFCTRIRLDAVAAGAHEVCLAGKTVDGHWRALGGRRRLIVTNALTPLPTWAPSLVEGGEAELTDEGGSKLTQIEVYRLGAALPFSGVLRRSTAIGHSVSVIARDADDGEFYLRAWSAPTDDPKAMLFGGEIPSRALSPGTYRLWVEAGDASERFVGRADTGCELVVRRADAALLRRERVREGTP